MAPSQTTSIACGSVGNGSWITVAGERDYAMGFGAHYRATPHVTLRAAETTFDVPPVWQPDRRLEYSSMEVQLFRKKESLELRV